MAKAQSKTTARRKPAAKAKSAAVTVANKAANRRWGVRIIEAAAVAIGVGGALLAFARFTRGDGGEHAAPDLAPDAPPPGTDRAPVVFRPDPTAVPSKDEYDSLRPATGPAPSLVEGEPGLRGPTTH